MKEIDEEISEHEQSTPHDYVISSCTIAITLLLGSAAQAGMCDSFTLSTIAGHSSVRVTERYIHPQAKLISEAFEKIANRKKVVIATTSEAGSNLRDSLQNCLVRSKLVELMGITHDLLTASG